MRGFAKGVRLRRTPFAVTLQGGIIRRFAKNVVRGIDEELAHHLIAAFGDPLWPVDVSGPILSSRQPKVASGVTGTSELLRIGRERGICAAGNRTDAGDRPQQLHVLLEVDVGVVLDLPVVRADALRKRLEPVDERLKLPVF